jgi:hypothetical protein
MWLNIYRLQKQLKNRSEVCLIIAANKMITVYWDMLIVCFPLHGLRFYTEEDGVCSFEVVVECYQITVCRIPEDSNLRRNRETGKELNEFSLIKEKGTNKNTSTFQGEDLKGKHHLQGSSVNRRKDVIMNLKTMVAVCENGNEILNSLMTLNFCRILYFVDRASRRNSGE